MFLHLFWGGKKAHETWGVSYSSQTFCSYFLSLQWKRGGWHPPPPSICWRESRTSYICFFHTYEKQTGGKQINETSTRCGDNAKTAKSAVDRVVGFFFSWKQQFTLKFSLSLFWTIFACGAHNFCFVLFCFCFRLQITPLSIISIIPLSVFVFFLFAK